MLAKCYGSNSSLLVVIIFIINDTRVHIIVIDRNNSLEEEINLNSNQSLVEILELYPQILGSESFTRWLAEVRGREAWFQHPHYL